MHNIGIKCLLASGISAFLLCFLALSCSESELERQFRMEKAINDANKLKERLYLSGGGLDDSERAELKAAFKAVVDMVSVPPADSAAIKNSPEALLVSWQLTGLALYNLGLLEMEMENYDQAFDHFSTLVDHYGFRRQQVQRALFMQALARYKQKRYPEAIILYNQVARNYAEAAEPTYKPNLDILESPLLAAKISREAEEEKRFREQVSESIDYYMGIIAAYEGTPLADAAVGKLASAFLLGNLADSAVAALSAIKDQDTGKIPPLVLLNIGTIQERNLKDYPEAEKTYRRFVSDYPENDLAPWAQTGIGITLYRQKDYDRARYELSLLDKFKTAPAELIAEAHYLTALCFEEEGKWDRALGEYDFVWTNHAASQKGMGVPIHIAEYYLGQGKKELAAQSFAKAEMNYKKLADTYSERPAIAAAAMGYIIRCYVLQEKWEEAAETFKEIWQKYPQTTEGYSALPQAADILANKLGKTAEAADLLRLHLEKYPELPAKEGLAAYADSLEKLSR